MGDSVPKHTRPTSLKVRASSFLDPLGGLWRLAPGEGRTRALIALYSLCSSLQVPTQPSQKE